MVTLNGIGVNCLWTLGCMVSFCLLFMESTESVALGCSPPRSSLGNCIPLVRRQLSLFLSGKYSVKYHPTESSAFSLRGCGSVQNWWFWLPLLFKHKIKPLEFGEAFAGGRTLSSPSNTSLRRYSASFSCQWPCTATNNSPVMALTQTMALYYSILEKVGQANCTVSSSWKVREVTQPHGLLRKWCWVMGVKYSVQCSVHSGHSTNNTAYMF